MSRVLRFHILLFLRLIIVVTRGVKFSPDAHKFQVIPCFWPVLGLLRHVEQRAKQALAHVLCDMHEIKAMWTAEETPVFQIPENRPRFPYPHQRLSLLFFLSRCGALFPSLPQVVDFFAAPSSWGCSKLLDAIEQMSLFPPRVFLGKPPPRPLEHGFL